jgi:glyceraldehyde 3-phosphate dehydrogenase
LQDEKITINKVEYLRKELAFQTDRRRAAVAFIKAVSDLWYDKIIGRIGAQETVIDR